MPVLCGTFVQIPGCWPHSLTGSQVLAARAGALRARASQIHSRKAKLAELAVLAVLAELAVFASTYFYYPLLGESGCKCKLFI